MVHRVCMVSKYMKTKVIYDVGNYLMSVSQQRVAARACHATSRVLSLDYAKFQ